MDDLLAVVEEHTGGNPMGPQKWVRRSLRNLGRDLARRGHEVSATTVGKLLRERHYTPKANRKRFTGPRHPEIILSRGEPKDLQFLPGFGVEFSAAIRLSRTKLARPTDVHESSPALCSRSSTGYLFGSVEL